MGRKGLKTEGVVQAISSLRAKGLPTTTRVVRLELENKGSYTTISRLLDELGAKSDAKVGEIAEMPPEVQQQMADCILSMWHAACKAGAAGSGRLRAQFDARLRMVSARLLSEQTARKRVASELCVTESELRTARCDRHVLEETIRTLREQLSVKHALLERAEHECNQMRKLLGPAAPSASIGPAQSAMGGRTRAGGLVHKATGKEDAQVLPL